MKQILCIWTLLSSAVYCVGQIINPYITNQEVQRGTLLLIVGGQSNEGTDPATGRVFYSTAPSHLQTPNYDNVWFYNVALAATGFTLYAPQADRQMGWLDQVLFPLSETYERVYVVKRSSTGTQLYPGGDSPDYPRAEMKTRASEAIAIMDGLYGADGYDKVMLWGQGESDADNAMEAAAYEQNLTDWIAELRAVIGVDVPWVLRMTGNLEIDFPYRAVVAAAQQAVADSDPLVHAVNCDNISMQSRIPGGTDDAHFGISGAIGIGKLMFDEVLRVLGRQRVKRNAPTLQTASVDDTGLLVTLEYDKPLNEGVNVYPRQWTIGTKTVTAVSISGTTVALTLGSPIRQGETPTVSYTKNLFYRENLQDLYANEVDDLVDVGITNNSTAPAATETLLYASDFSVGTDGFNGTSGGVPTGGVTVAGIPACLKVEGSDDSPIIEKYFGSSSFMTSGSKYKLTFDLYVPPLFGYDQNNPKIQATVITTHQIVLDLLGLFYRGEDDPSAYSFQSYEVEFTASTDKGFLRFEALSGNFVTDGQYFALKNVKIYSVT